MSMSSVKFDSSTYPVYYTYGNEAVSQDTIAGGRCAHTQIYLLGTSKDAHVMVKNSKFKEVAGGTTATYTPMATPPSRATATALSRETGLIK